jgi:hypothetical protein
VGDDEAPIESPKGVNNKNPNFKVPESKRGSMANARDAKRA